MPKKILVVEDNEKNRVLVRDILTYYGFNIIEASNGADGIEMAREHRPDMIMLDIQMPVMDGLTAIKVLKDIPEIRDTKIVALTSFAMKGDKERIMAAGFDSYIPKPINTRQLPGIIISLLE